MPQDSSTDTETLVDAFYVDFTGKTFAYLTKGHELPVLNGYFAEDAPQIKVPMRNVSELLVGDVVMFRESGDSDIIRFLAEDEIGKDRYQALRTAATRWRSALHTLGSDPRTVWDRLRLVGSSRQFQTVKTWCEEDRRICPKDIEDVRKIAEASQDHDLLSAIPQLEEAKNELMSLHISAGFRLTHLLMKELPKKKMSLLGGEMQLDLGVGKVWVVRIADVDHSVTPQRRSQANRLLWDVQG